MGMSPTAAHLRSTGTLQDRGIERLTRDCLAMTDTAAAARIDREVAAAIESSRWEDAVKWQRVRLRVKRMRARISS